MGGWDGEGWFSVELRPEQSDVAMVTLYAVMTRGGMELAPFDIYLGDFHGDLDTRCAGPILESPDINGQPMRVPCMRNGTDQRFVTVKHRGRLRAFSMTEMVVYVRGGQARGRRGNIVAEIQSRFANGVPSNDAAAAGVLMHKLDSYEMPGHEWDLCYGTPERRCPLPVDHVSCSLINHDRPNPWGWMVDDYVGVILAVDTPILCGYAGDVGTGGSVNGACGFCSADGCSGGGRGYDVAEAIRRSDGSNEMVIGELEWAQHQPDIFDAVVFMNEGEASARVVHQRFMSHFGLLPSELPLVRYDVRTREFTEVPV